MTVFVRSLLPSSQTLDSVALPAFATQIRNVSTAALVAAVAARSIQMEEYGGVEYNAPLTGVSKTLPDNCEVYICEPAGTIAAHTVVMPENPVDRQRLTMSFDQIVTALTMTPGTSQTINGALTAATAKGFATWMFNEADLTWYRIG